MLGSWTATTSPRPTPRSAMPRASESAPSRNSRLLSVVVPERIAGAPGASSARRSTRPHRVRLMRPSSCGLLGRAVLHLVARGARLEAQVLLLGALARRVAERLVAAREVLRRPVLPQVLVPGRGLQREVWVGEVRPRQRHQVGLARGEQ